MMKTVCLEVELEMDWITFRNDLARERYDEAATLATKHDVLRKSWDDCWKTLKNLSINLKGKLELVQDFAPMSLAWAIIREDGTCSFNGGLIFHGGNEEWSGGFPTLAVTLDNVTGWSIHT